MKYVKILPPMPLELVEWNEAIQAVRTMLKDEKDWGGRERKDKAEILKRIEAPPAFVPMHDFAGNVEGYAFHEGKYGLGYYPDAALRRKMEVASLNSRFELVRDLEKFPIPEVNRMKKRSAIQNIIQKSNRVVPLILIENNDKDDGYHIEEAKRDDGKDALTHQEQKTNSTIYPEEDAASTGMHTEVSEKTAAIKQSEEMDKR